MKISERLKNAIIAMRPKSLAKKGFNVSGKGISALAFGVVAFIVLIQIAADVLPTAQTAGNDLNATGLPLASLFAGDGVVFTVIMAALLLGTVAWAMKQKGSR